MFSWLFVTLIVIVGINITLTIVEINRQKRCEQYMFAYRRYRRASHERMEHEEMFGKDSAPHQLQLQELLRRESGALAIVRIYFPKESLDLEHDMYELIGRMHEDVVR